MVVTFHSYETTHSMIHRSESKSPSATPTPPVSPTLGPKRCCSNALLVPVTPSQRHRMRHYGEEMLEARWREARQVHINWDHFSITLPFGREVKVSLPDPKCIGSPLRASSRQ